MGPVPEPPPDDPVDLCGGCGAELRPDDWIELCVVCEAPICGWECWERWGYCGPTVHPRWAALMEEFQRPDTTPARRAEIMTKELGPIGEPKVRRRTD
jgi:hypothetical protein